MVKGNSITNHYKAWRLLQHVFNFIALSDILLFFNSSEENFSARKGIAVLRSEKRLSIRVQKWTV